MMRFPSSMSFEEDGSIIRNCNHHGGDGNDESSSSIGRRQRRHGLLLLQRQQMVISRILVLISLVLSITTTTSTLNSQQHRLVVVLADAYVVSVPSSESTTITTTSTRLTLDRLHDGRRHPWATTSTTITNSRLHQSSVPLVDKAEVETQTETSSSSTTTTTVSWEELQDRLLELSSQQHQPAEEQEPGPEQEQPVLTLYRDTNGWCPFCERVWIAINAKGLPYKETLINLQNKPQWYKDLVPTTLVPAVVIYNNNNDESNKTQRTLIWESDAILKALDDHFPDMGPKLVPHHDKAYQEALELQTRVQSTGFQFVYGGRNESVTELDREQHRINFVQALDDLDDALGQNLVKDHPSLPLFRLGSNFTALDAIMMPTLERWRYQLPITTGFDILEGRNHLQRWFDTMDNFGPYNDRVAGDEYSWVATTSMFLRYFGGGEDKPDVQQAIQRADETAATIAKTFGEYQLPYSHQRRCTLEAVTKLISNHEPIVADCTNSNPTSQTHVSRATNPSIADVVLRDVATILLNAVNEDYQQESSSSTTTNDDDDDDNDSTMVTPRAIELAKISILVSSVDNPADAAIALRTVATRLCVPRDMGRGAAGILRGVLSVLADRYEEVA